MFQIKQAHDMRNLQAHDMRNCLYLAASFAELMRNGLGGPVTPLQLKFLGHILECTARAQKLVAPPANPNPAERPAPCAETTSAGRILRAA